MEQHGFVKAFITLCAFWIALSYFKLLEANKQQKLCWGKECVGLAWQSLTACPLHCSCWYCQFGYHE